MGRTLTSISFFTEDITLVPHTATEAKHLERPVSIAEFAAGREVSLSLIEGTNPAEFVVSTRDREFMEGPMA